MARSVLQHPPIPKATHRAHLKQRNQFCDQPRVLDMAQRYPLGRRFADMNMCEGADVDVNLHWPDGPRKNHYRYIQGPGGKRRKMTRAEQHRPVREWTAAQIATWRKRRFPVGRVGKHTVGTVAQRQQEAKARKVVICWEVKSRGYREQATAARAVAAVEASGWPAYFMTLVTMRDWGGKMRAFHSAGAQTALLAHGAHKPRNLDDYAPWIDRVWGRWHR